MNPRFSRVKENLLAKSKPEPTKGRKIRKRSRFIGGFKT
jgi:hypothetical protein